MNYFVFVVCGAKTHIDTLHVSLRFLRHFSTNPILVVTDMSRNEIPVNHDNIINIATPTEYDHHQASIYLKTGLYRFVPDIQNNTYCYLDSDIIAVSDNCNKIFNYQPDPVFFAKDLSAFSEFSPQAMNCGCLTDFQRFKTEFNSPMSLYFEDFKPLKEQTQCAHDRLNQYFSILKKHPFTHANEIAIYLIRRYLSLKRKINISEFVFNKKNRCWYDHKGNMISFDYRYHRHRLLQKAGIYFKNGFCFNKNHEMISLQTPYCSHLAEHVNAKFGIEIPSSWRHWNGGVFVLNKKSLGFMDFWHRITLEEFADTATKTRDQGTLAVSAWKFNIQDSETLPQDFNFITEYDNPDIHWSETKGYTRDGFQNSFEPAMLHIYHHWGDTNWDIWQSVLYLAEKNNIPLDTEDLLKY